MIAPVIFIVFNRPEQTARVLDRIRRARPRVLFVVADGPRPNNQSDVIRCAEVRRLIVSGIDWPCDLTCDFSEINLGCGRRVASGITNAFQKVEEAIILEDDCLPDESFFRFCSEVLIRYRNEKNIGLVGGSHHLQDSRYGSDSYFFCRYGYTWGWATWRRAWVFFDYEMREWPKWRDGGGLKRTFPRRDVQRYWRHVWNDAAAGKDDIWDYQWTFCYIRHGMLAVLPQTCLVENIGFGVDATHTFDPEQSPVVEPMRFPLKHPTEIVPDAHDEAFASQRLFSRPNLLKRVARGVVRRALAVLR